MVTTVEELFSPSFPADSTVSKTYKWLLQNLQSLPHFEIVRATCCFFLRQVSLLYGQFIIWLSIKARVPSRFFGIRDYPYLTLGIRVFPYLTLGIRNFPYLTLGIRDFPYLTLGIRNFPYLTLGIRIFPYLPLGIRDFAHLTLGIRDFPYLTLGIREVPYLMLGIKKMRARCGIEMCTGCRTLETTFGIKGLNKILGQDRGILKSVVALIDIGASPKLTNSQTFKRHVTPLGA